MGVSLGGNQLAKYLGDRGTDAGFLTAAVSVGAPLDLVAGSERISKGVNTFMPTCSFTRSARSSSSRRSSFPT